MNAAVCVASTIAVLLLAVVAIIAWETFQQHLAAQEVRVALLDGAPGSTKWVTSKTPAADLSADLREPETKPDGTVVYYFHTANGARFAKVVEVNGFTFWMQEVKA